MKVIKKYSDYFRHRTNRGGASFYILRGGRRSGKTFAICQRLLLLCCNNVRVVNVATMTAEQGRLGAYADMKTIISGDDFFSMFVESTLESPREIRFVNGSRIFFNSYQNSETAKGIACDYVFLNEANNFSKQQYVDLIANARRGVYLDFNPNVKFWVDDFFSESDILTTTWRDNLFLTNMQLKYFEDLKRLGTAPNASAVDVRNYKVYYLGEYCELSGKIFNVGNLKEIDKLPTSATHFMIFCDPSALRGSDWFACVLSARDGDGNVYICDTYSVNEGSREDIVRHIRGWCAAYDVERILVETNGIIGIDFFEFCQNSDLPVEGWYSRGNKFDRIVSNYQNICEYVKFVATQSLPAFLDQIYEFDTKCDHDDNIDAVVSSLKAHQYSV